MSPAEPVCILVAEVSGAEALVKALGAGEAKHAIDRCLHRVDRAVAAAGGSLVRREADRLSARFARCDAAVLAAADMFVRVEGLPPQRGLRLTVQVGIHQGAGAAASGSASGAEAAAGRLAAVARPGQVLASNPAVIQLSEATRHFAGTSAVRGKAVDGFEWPVFPIHRRAGLVTPGGSLARPPQRLRVRHQHEVLYVEANRPVVLLGREPGNDVVIVDPRASRQHARIERREQGFVLIDQSTNGTYVAADGGAEHCVRRDEHPLDGAGRLGCGFSANAIERDLVFFELT